MSNLYEKICVPQRKKKEKFKFLDPKFLNRTFVKCKEIPIDNDPDRTTED